MAENNFKEKKVNVISLGREMSDYPEEFFDRLGQRYTIISQDERSFFGQIDLDKVRIVRKSQGRTGDIPLGAQVAFELYSKKCIPEQWKWPELQTAGYDILISAQLVLERYQGESAAYIAFCGTCFLDTNGQECFLFLLFEAGIWKIQCLPKSILDWPFVLYAVL